MPDPTLGRRGTFQSLVYSLCSLFVYVIFCVRVVDRDGLSVVASNVRFAFFSFLLFLRLGLTAVLWAIDVAAHLYRVYCCHLYRVYCCIYCTRSDSLIWLQIYCCRLPYFSSFFYEPITLPAMLTWTCCKAYPGLGNQSIFYPRSSVGSTITFGVVGRTRVRIPLRTFLLKEMLARASY